MIPHVCVGFPRRLSENMNRNEGSTNDIHCLLNFFMTTLLIAHQLHVTQNGNILNTLKGCADIFLGQ